MTCRTRGAAAATAGLLAALTLAGCVGVDEPLGGANVSPRDSDPPRDAGSEPAAAAEGPVAEVRGVVRVEPAFAVTGTRLSLAARDAAALGGPDAPVGLADPPARARTALQRDHWILVAELRESAPGSAAPGLYRATLTWADESAGEVLLQRARDAPGRVGAELRFDLGTVVSNASSFVLEVAADADTPQHTTFDLRSDGSFQAGFAWVAPDGGRNPPLRAAAGARVSFRITHGDGEDDFVPHDFRVKDASGAVVAGLDGDVEAAGDTATLTWTAPAPGTYRYECRYHAPAQAGTLTVA